MRTYLLILMIFSTLAMKAQEERKVIREGNKYYEEGNFKEAELDYLRSLEINPESVEGKFNYGNTLYRQEQFDKATEIFTDLAGSTKDPQTKARAFHNLGNSLLKEQKIEESIDAYINALKNNPDDIDTKYNLQYARRLLQQQQQQQKQDQNKDQQDQNKDKHDQDKKDNKDQEGKDKNSEENKGQDQKEQQKDQQGNNSENSKDQNPKDQKQDQGQQAQDGDKDKDQQEQGAKASKSKISKEDAKRMLQALAKQEKQIQKKIRKQKTSTENIEKNW